MISQERSEARVVMLPWEFRSSDCAVVYRYTSTAAARAMVEKRSIWLSEYTAMNDASEFAYPRDRIYALMRNREFYMDALTRYCLIMAIEDMSARTGLMLGSLTARRDDLGQWRSYASNGAGCALGIDAAYLHNDAGIAIRRVLYDEIEVDRMLRAALMVVQQHYTEAPGDFETLVGYARAASDLFNIKHPCFADEREMRIARMVNRVADGSFRDVGGHRADGSAVAPLPVSRRIGRFGETAYVALPLIRSDGSSAIVSLSLGPAMSTTDRTDHRSFFEGHGLAVWQSALPYRI